MGVGQFPVAMADLFEHRLLRGIRPGAVRCGEPLPGQRLAAWRPFLEWSAGSHALVQLAQFGHQRVEARQRGRFRRLQGLDEFLPGIGVQPRQAVLRQVLPLLLGGFDAALQLALKMQELRRRAIGRCLAQGRLKPFGPFAQLLGGPAQGAQRLPLRPGFAIGVLVPVAGVLFQGRQALIAGAAQRRQQRFAEGFRAAQEEFRQGFRVRCRSQLSGLLGGGSAAHEHLQQDGMLGVGAQIRQPPGRGIGNGGIVQQFDEQGLIFNSPDGRLPNAKVGVGAGAGRQLRAELGRAGGSQFRNGAEPLLGALGRKRISAF